MTTNDRDIQSILGHEDVDSHHARKLAQLENDPIIGPIMRDGTFALRSDTRVKGPEGATYYLSREAGGHLVALSTRGEWSNSDTAEVSPTIAIPDDPEEFTVAPGLRNGGAVLTTGNKFWWEMPYDADLISVKLKGDQDGTIVMDVRASPLTVTSPGANYSITGPVQINTTNRAYYEDSTLSGWRTRILEGEWISLHIISVSTFTQVTPSLKFRKV